MKLLRKSIQIELKDNKINYSADKIGISNVEILKQMENIYLPEISNKTDEVIKT